MLHNGKKLNFFIPFLRQESENQEKIDSVSSYNSQNSQINHEESETKAEEKCFIEEKVE